MKRSLPKKRDLAWAVVLLLVGVGGLWLNHDVDLYSPLLWTRLPAWVLIPLYMIFQFSLIAAVGAGFGAPFRRKLLGAGTAILLMTLIALMIYLPNRHGK